MVQKLKYSWITRSMSWMLMTWFLVVPCHQQKYHRLCMINGSLSMRKDSKYLCILRFEKWRKMQIYFSVSNAALHSLNAALQSLSADTGIIFANQHELFHLQNGNINDSYLADNVHLAMKGSGAMARKMGIKLRHGCASVADARPKQTPPITWKSNEG